MKSKDSEENKTEEDLDLDAENPMTFVGNINEGLFEEKDYQNIQNELREQKKIGVEAENELLNEIEAYYEQLKDEMNSIMEIYEKEISKANILKLKSQKIEEEIERDHIQSEEYKEENQSLEGFIKIETNKNSTIESVFHEINIIEKVYSSIAYLDLTTIGIFKKYLSDQSNNHIYESTPILRGIGGEYLKRQTSILYYLELLKQRYSITKIPQDSEVSQEFNYNNQRADPDQIRQFENKIKIIYYNESFLINLDNDEKKEKYTFKDLKEEACDLFAIPKDLRKSYHIVNDKMFVYSYRTRVWEIHKIAVESNRSSLTWAHMELLDKMSIFMNRSTNINHKDVHLAKIMIDNENVKQSNLNEINEHEIFTSELEDYVQLYRRAESLYLYFKTDEDKMSIINKFKERSKQFEDERTKALKDLELNDDEEITEEKINGKYDELLKIENQKYNDEMYKHNKKPEQPIYFSEKNIYNFRLMKYWYFFINIYFAITFYYFFNATGTLNLEQTGSIKTFIDDTILFNPLYKNFLKNKDALKKKDFNRMIRSRNEVLLWLDVLFNNLILNNNLNETNAIENDLDIYNNFFLRRTSSYEVLNGIRFTFQTQQISQNKSDADHIIKLNETYKQNLNYTTTFSPVTVETHPKLIEPSIFDGLKVSDNLLNKLQKSICANCFTNSKLDFNNNMTNYFTENGVYSDYSDGSYIINLNNFEINRSDFDYIFHAIKNILLSDSNIRIFKINFNVLHVYFQMVAKIDIVFEFSNIGDLQVNEYSTVIDSGTNTSFSYIFFQYSHYIRIIFFTIDLILKVVTKRLLRNKVKSLSNLAILYDLIVYLLYISLMILANEYSNQAKTYFSMMAMNQTFTNETAYSYEYVDYSSIIMCYTMHQNISGLISLMLFLRVIFYVNASPLIYFIIKVTTQTMRALVNVLIVLVMFILSFSLIMHVILGKRTGGFVNLSTSIVNSVFSILGSLKDDSFGAPSLYEHIIIITFLVMIKFVLFTFVYALIKEQFDRIKTHYQKYKKKEHFKIIGESIYIFIKFSIFPINIYWMIKEYLHLKKKFEKVNLEKLVSEEEIVSIIFFLLLEGLTYQKLIIEKRVVYFIHSLKLKN